MTRQRLPNRRRSENFELRFAGTNLTVTIGHDRAGSPREVFINSRKIGSELDVAGRDCAILVSLLLQFGATPSEILHSLTKDESGAPEGMAGIVLTHICNMEGAADGR